MGQGDELLIRLIENRLGYWVQIGEPINPEAWEWYFRVVGR